MKFDLLPTVVYAWRVQGQPQYIPTPGKNIRLAVCGAFRWPVGPFVFTHDEKSVNTDVFLELLKLLVGRAKRTGRRIVLVLDNGRTFTSKKSSAALRKVEALLIVFWLPTYSSERLNDIERMWKYFKENFFSRMLAKTREDFRKNAIALLRSFRNPGTLHRVLPRSVGQ